MSGRNRTFVLSLVILKIRFTTSNQQKIYLSKTTYHPLKIPQILLRKEVIQPQVPLRLPCYDFIPVTEHSFGASLFCKLGQRLWVHPAPVM